MNADMMGLVIVALIVVIGVLLGVIGYLVSVIVKNNLQSQIQILEMGRDLKAMIPLNEVGTFARQFMEERRIAATKTENPADDLLVAAGTAVVNQILPAAPEQKTEAG